MQCKQRKQYYFLGQWKHCKHCKHWKQSLAVKSVYMTMLPPLPKVFLFFLKITSAEARISSTVRLPMWSEEKNTKLWKHWLSTLSFIIVDSHNHECHRNHHCFIDLSDLQTCLVWCSSGTGERSPCTLCSRGIPRSRFHPLMEDNEVTLNKTHDRFSWFPYGVCSVIMAWDHFLWKMLE